MSDKSITTEQSEFIPSYEGSDMAGYIMKVGFELPENYKEQIKSITNVRDTAIIVTDWSIWRAKPSYQIGFCIELLMRF